MPIAVKNRVVDGGKPVSSGTRNVAPNIATTCWAPMPIVRGHVIRSSGRTISPGRIVFPSPWMRHGHPLVLSSVLIRTLPALVRPAFWP